MERTIHIFEQYSPERLAENSKIENKFRRVTNSLSTLVGGTHMFTITSLA